ncbi:MAG: serine/threonine protein kinase [Cyanobacteria bacterium SZAS TMP-1]|nr:serine/threonine protein kinase [Cyanobacteria bacterium SZAS TMP-1]
MTDSSGNLQHQSTYPPGDTTFVSSVNGAQREFIPGEIIDGSYKLSTPLGRGGMGSVFACEHLALGKQYAIKMVHGDKLTAEQWERFQAEAKALAQLNHPAIVGIHNMGVHAGQFPYYVMDLLSGESLEQLIIKNGGLPVGEALDYVIQIADALSSAHSKGIIHRDVKPSNIMLIRDYSGKIISVKLVDFGIARLSREGFGAQSQTATGLVFGTPYYMSPEQCQGQKVDARSDIYSLGCTLFECLTGRVPFRGDNSFQTFMLHQSEQPPRLKDAKETEIFSDALEAAVAKMMAKAPENRYQTMEQLKHDLERIKAGKPIGSDYSKRGATSQFWPAVESIETEDEDEAATDPPTQRTAMATIGASVIALGILAIIAATGYGAYIFIKPSSSAGTASDASKALNLGFYTELTELDTFNKIREEAPVLQKRLNAYREATAANPPKLKQYAPPGLHFPDNFIIGQVRFSGGEIEPAVGLVPIPPGQKVCLILTKYIDLWPEFWAEIGPYDINGLEIKTRHSTELIQYLHSWRALDELCFFNTLLKAVPDQNPSKPKDDDNESGSDESALSDADLPEIDKLSTLKSLGLCGIHVTGNNIVKMKLFRTVDTLKLKRVSNAQKVIDSLPERDNIKELWLVAMDTTDEQIATLAKMKNLETLRIRRSKVTPASFNTFKKMKTLKAIYLDRVFPNEEAERFQKELPYRYETLTDPTYWRLLPEKAEP